MTSIETVVQNIRANITQGEKSSLYKGQDMGARYSLFCNKPASGVQGLTDAVAKALEMDGCTTRVLIGDNFSSDFNAQHNLGENQICVLASNVTA